MFVSWEGEEPAGTSVGVLGEAGVCAGGGSWGCVNRTDDMGDVPDRQGGGESNTTVGVVGERGLPVGGGMLGRGDGCANSM